MLAIDIVLSGLILGGTYALIALGLTLQYGVARIMNLAYGELLVAAAFGAYWLFTAKAVSPIVGLAVIVPAAFAVNWLIYTLLLTPLVRRAKSRDALEADSILATFGMLFVVQGGLLVLFGGQYYSDRFLQSAVVILGDAVEANKLVTAAFAIVAAVGLTLALTYTRTGTAIRAVAVAPGSARLVGIDVPRLSAFAFALGGALSAAAGVLVSMSLLFSATSGVLFTMKALIIVIMGGAGNLLGALIAGLILGIAEIAVARLIDPGLTIAINFVLFLAVLLVRPAGLFGRAAS
jgi:branched-chain amino acid transport system permease protein